MKSYDEVYFHIGLHKTGTTYLQEKVFPDLDLDFCNIPDHHYFHAPEGEFSNNSLLMEIERKTKKKGSNKLLVSQEFLSGDIEDDKKIDKRLIASRIKSLFPKAKILIVLRNQVDYVESLYNFRVVIRGHEHRSFRKYLDEELPDLMGKLQYENLVEYYYGLFAPDNVKILLYEELNENPAAFLGAVCDWLGMDKGQFRSTKVNSVQRNDRLISSHRIINLPLDVTLNQMFKWHLIGPTNLSRLRNYYYKFKRLYLADIIELVVGKDTKPKRLLQARHLNAVFDRSNTKLQGLIDQDLTKYGYPSKKMARITLKDPEETPFFMVVGAMKSGTTTIYSNLVNHPDIGMSVYKETDFFNENFEKGISWYKSLFPKGKQVNGDVSPNYSKAHIWPQTSLNMYNSYPNAKIIYVVRDPLDRIISHLHHDLYRDRLRWNEVEKEVLQSNDYIMTSSYDYQLNEFRRYFTDENILVISFQDLVKDLNASLNRICRFIGVNEHDFAKKTRITNTSDKKYWIMRYDLVHSVLPDKFAKIYHWLFYFFNIKFQRPNLSEETSNKLMVALSEDLNRFEEQYDMVFDDLPTTELKSNNSIEQTHA